MASTSTFLKLNLASELSEAHTEVLEGRLTTIAEMQLKPERTRNSNTILVGRWDEKANMAIVEVTKGTHLNTMGVRGRVDMLYPEEMMFLVNKSRMCLFLGDSDRPASIEACMALVFESGVTLPEFLVYSHLKSVGCIVFRHGQHWPPLESSSEVRVAFDVWLPHNEQEKSWSRKNVPPPSFHLVLITDTSYTNEYRAGEHVSMVKQLATWTSAAQVPLRLATCDSCGLIEFFECSPIGTPQVL